MRARKFVFQSTRARVDKLEEIREALNHTLRSKLMRVVRFDIVPTHGSQGYGVVVIERRPGPSGRNVPYDAKRPLNRATTSTGSQAQWDDRPER